MTNGDKGGRGVKKSHFCGDVIFERPLRTYIKSVYIPEEVSTWPLKNDNIKHYTATRNLHDLDIESILKNILRCDSG